MTTTPPPLLSYASPLPKDKNRRGRGFLAVCAGFAVTGLGHVVVGRYRRGLVWLLGWALIAAAMYTAICLPRLLPALIVLFPLCAIWGIASLVDAYLCGRRSEMGLLRSPVFRYLAGIAIITISIVAGRFANPSMAITMYVKQHVTEGFVITTNSMAPTLLPRDKVLCSKNMSVTRWSIAVVDSPMTPGVRYVKRVVGLPRETVQIIDGHVSINGVALASPPGIPRYVTSRADDIPIHGPGCDAPIVLGPDEYYFLGDNSPISGDSRYWPSVGQHQPGALPATSIVGPATYIYWPPNRWRRLF
jgi:signal peptidase I